MKGRKTSIILLILTFLVIFSTLVNAKEDFSAATSSRDIDICVMTTSDEIIKITNTGDTYSEYRIGLTGSASDFVTPLPPRFDLMPGESQIVRNYFNFPSYEKGEYELKTIIGTNMGLRKQLTQKVSSELCNNNYLIALNFNQSSCPCREMTYEFLLKNVGEYAETYVFGVDKFAEYANLSVNPLVLGPGEEKRVRLYFNVDCAIYGEFIVNFYSTSQIAGIRTKVPLLLDIKRCYDYDINTGRVLDDNENKVNTDFIEQESSYSICGGDKKSIQLQVDNYGYIDNNFYYSAEGEDWGEIYGNAFELNAREMGYTYLDVAPDKDLIGEYKFIVNVASQKGNMKKQKVVTVEVVDCYGLVVEAEEEEICNCVDSEISFAIANIGEYEEDIIMKLEGNGDFALLDNVTTIRAGGSEEIKINASPGCDTRGRKDVKVKAWLENGNAYDEDTLKVDIIPVEKCYDLKIEADSSAELVEGKTIVPVSVVHKGTKEGEYRIGLYGERWISVDADEFFLRPEERYSFNVVAEPGDRNLTEGSYYATVNMSVDDAVVYQTKIRFRNVGEGDLSLFLNTLSYFRYWIYTAICILVLLFVFSRYTKEKARVWKIKTMIKKARKEDVKKAGKKGAKDVVIKEKGSKIWNYVLAAIVLISIILFYPGMFMGLVTDFAGFVMEYVVYIIIGFVVLLIVIFVMEKNN
jgi:hypothetical protein